jgi:hypothetical protein
MSRFVVSKNNTFKPDSKPEKVEKKKVYKIAPLSKKRAEQNKEYSRIARVWIVGKIDPENGQPAETIHHKKGRIGNLLLDTRYWLGVTMETHTKIENHPEWAYEKGYSLLRTAK